MPGADRMANTATQVFTPKNEPIILDRILLTSSLALQAALAYFFGHAYDTRIFMATGYLAGTGQNPYVPQDLSTVFHNGAFQGITSIG